MAQQNITTLQSNINTQIADNTAGDISAADVRNNLINMTDSLLFNSGSVAITGSLSFKKGVGTNNVAIGTNSLLSIVSGAITLVLGKMLYTQTLMPTVI